MGESKSKGGQEPARLDARFPWRPPAVDRARRWMLSPHVTVASRLVAAQVLTGLFVVVRPLAFQQACLAPILAIASLLVLSPGVTLGCQLQGACMLLSSALYGPALAGALVTLARAAGSGFVPVLLALCAVALLPLAVIRARHPNFLMGMVQTAVFGVSVILAVPAWPAAALWQGVAFLVTAVCVSAAGCLLSAALVLPVLASKQLRGCVGASLEGMGHQLSAYASALLSAPGSEQSGADVAWLAALHTTAPSADGQMRVVEDAQPGAAFLAAMLRQTDPEKPARQPRPTPPHPAAGHLRALLSQASAHIAEAELEPACLAPGPQGTCAWRQVVGDCKTLLTRVGVLQLLVEGGHLVDGSRLLAVCGSDPLPSLRLVFARLAAACKTLGSAVTFAQQVLLLKAAVPWPSLREELAAATGLMRAGFQQHHWRAGEAAEPLLPQPEQLELRLALFVVAAADGLISSLAALEASLPAALGLETQRSCTSGSQQQAGQAPEQEQPSPTLLHANLERGQASDIAITVKGPQPSQCRSLRQQCRFLGKLLHAICAPDMLLVARDALWIGARRSLSSRADMLAMLRSRHFQYGAKFWVGSCSALAAVVSLVSAAPRSRSWGCHFGFMACVFSLQERVEAATWRLAQRLAGTCVGGLLAFCLLTRLYREPGAPLLAAVCALSFCLAQAAHSRARFAVALALITLTSLTVCSYPECCVPASGGKLLAARLVNILAGCALGMALACLLLPWTTRREHMELLAEALEGGCCVAADCSAAFRAACQADAEGRRQEAAEAGAERALDARLQQCVGTVERVALGLQTLTVAWQAGPLATPQLTPRLVTELRKLTHRLAALLQLAVAQGPAELGSTSALFRCFLQPLQPEIAAAMQGLAALGAACALGLRQGGQAGIAPVQAQLQRFEAARAAVQQRIQRLKHPQHGYESEPCLTAADALKLGSFLTAASKVCDQGMLIARLLLLEWAPACCAKA